MTISFSLTPSQTAKALLQRLPAKRMRVVLERRFGLVGRERDTLENIGKEYKITRERVRQIEADALRRLQTDAADIKHDFLRPIAEEMEKRGRVVAEQHLFETVAHRRFHPYLRLLLHTEPGFHFIPETEHFHARWALDPAAAEKGEHSLRSLAARLHDTGRPVAKTALFEMLSSGDSDNSDDSRDPPGGMLDGASAESYLRASKQIQQNPYGEYGLAEWPAISPRGIRDKAYAVLEKSGAPMHFRTVASAIDRAGWPQRKKAHPQTVHNELIKDGRFVLVGRGMYALREWGYEPGTVRDVLVSLLKQSGRPLNRDEVVQKAREKRMVKPQTILLNLQDRDLFKRTDDGKYTLV